MVGHYDKMIPASYSLSKIEVDYLLNDCLKHFNYINIGDYKKVKILPEGFKELKKIKNKNSKQAFIIMLFF